MTSLTTASPCASAARRSSFRPSSPSPWNAYGEVRGLYAPPRSTVAPAAATARAIVNTCSSPSTEHGPAMIASCGPPIATLPTEMTVSWGWNARLASLNGRTSLLTDSTPGQRSTSFQSTAVVSPTAATRVRPSCSVRCTASPAMRSRVSTLAALASGVPGFRITSTGSQASETKKPTPSGMGWEIEFVGFVTSRGGRTRSPGDATRRASTTSCTRKPCASQTSAGDVLERCNQRSTQNLRGSKNDGETPRQRSLLGHEPRVVDPRGDARAGAVAAVPAHRLWAGAELAVRQLAHDAPAHVHEHERGAARMGEREVEPAAASRRVRRRAGEARHRRLLRAVHARRGQWGEQVGTRLAVRPRAHAYDATVVVDAERPRQQHAGIRGHERVQVHHLVVAPEERDLHLVGARGRTDHLVVVVEAERRAVDAAERAERLHDAVRPEEAAGCGIVVLDHAPAADVHRLVDVDAVARGTAQRAQVVERAPRLGEERVELGIARRGGEAGDVTCLVHGERAAQRAPERAHRVHDAVTPPERHLLLVHGRRRADDEAIVVHVGRIPAGPAERPQVGHDAVAPEERALPVH